ncbi:helicase associated domain-containing protein [Seiridium cupressi]
MVFSAAKPWVSYVSNDRIGAPASGWDYQSTEWQAIHSRLSTAASGYQRRQEFLAPSRNNQLMVVIDGTGSGKTTQIPQFILGDDLGDKLMIACTQPRRIAASSMATRVTQEADVELGDIVGFGTRFEKMASNRTRIRFLTDGLLFAESSQDRDFTRYSCIIVDEAHER